MTRAGWLAAGAVVLSLGAEPAWACRSPGSTQGVIFDTLPAGIAPPKSVWGGRLEVSAEPWTTYRWRGETLHLAGRFDPTVASGAGFGRRRVLVAIRAVCSSPGIHGLEGMIVGQEVARDARRVIILADQESIAARRKRKAEE